MAVMTDLLNSLQPKCAMTDNGFSFIFALIPNNDKVLKVQ